jgi:hypothetical protein
MAISALQGSWHSLLGARCRGLTFLEQHVVHAYMQRNNSIGFSPVAFRRYNFISGFMIKSVQGSQFKVNLYLSQQTLKSLLLEPIFSLLAAKIQNALPLPSWNGL